MWHWAYLTVTFLMDFAWCFFRIVLGVPFAAFSSPGAFLSARTFPFLLPVNLNRVGNNKEAWILKGFAALSSGIRSEGFPGRACVPGVVCIGQEPLLALPKPHETLKTLRHRRRRRRY